MVLGTLEKLKEKQMNQPTSFDLKHNYQELEKQIIDGLELLKKKRLEPDRKMLILTAIHIARMHQLMIQTYLSILDLQSKPN